MTNVQSNRFSKTFTQVEADELAISRRAYLDLVKDKTIALTPDELNELSSMAVDNFVFVKDMLMANDAEGIAMLPPAYAAEAPELSKDTSVFDFLDMEEMMIDDLKLRIQHTKRLVAHEAYSLAIKFYKLYKQMAEDGVPGAAARYNALKARFKDNGGGRAIEPLSDPGN